MEGKHFYSRLCYCWGRQLCDLQLILIGNEVFVFLFLLSPTCPQREDTLMVLAAMDGQLFTPRCIIVVMVGTRGRTASSCLYCLRMTYCLVCFLVCLFLLCCCCRCRCCCCWCSCCCFVHYIKASLVLTTVPSRAYVLIIINCTDNAPVPVLKRAPSTVQLHIITTHNT